MATDFEPSRRKYLRAPRNNTDVRGAVVSARRLAFDEEDQTVFYDAARRVFSVNEIRAAKRTERSGAAFPEGSPVVLGDGVSGARTAAGATPTRNEN